MPCQTPIGDGNHGNLSLLKGRSLETLLSSQSRGTIGKRVMGGRTVARKLSQGDGHTSARSLYHCGPDPEVKASLRGHTAAQDLWLCSSSYFSCVLCVVLAFFKPSFKSRAGTPVHGTFLAHQTSFTVTSQTFHFFPCTPVAGTACGSVMRGAGQD